MLQKGAPPAFTTQRQTPRPMLPEGRTTCERFFVEGKTANLENVMRTVDAPTS